MTVTQITKSKPKQNTTITKEKNYIKSAKEQNIKTKVDIDFVPQKKNDFILFCFAFFSWRGGGGADAERYIHALSHILYLE